MGAVSDGLLKSTGEQWPSNYTGREFRREQERRQRRAKKSHCTTGGTMASQSGRGF